MEVIQISRLYSCSTLIPVCIREDTNAGGGMKGDNISLEHFLGSVATKITTVNENTIKVEIFNVTSFSSGYLQKDIPVVKWFVSSPNSTKRNIDGYFSKTYSNTSQYFSFTMSTSEANKLIKQYSSGTAPQKK